MDSYLVVKWMHILSSTLLFGTGIGTAFFMMMAIQTGDVHHIAKTARTVVLADWLFTATSGVVQPLTGLYLVHVIGHSLWDSWLFWTLVLYAMALACWLPVVWLQIRMHRMADAAVKTGTPLPQTFYTYFKYWFALGWPAFVGLLVVFYLMVAKPV